MRQDDSLMIVLFLHASLSLRTMNPVADSCADSSWDEQQRLRAEDEARQLKVERANMEVEMKAAQKHAQIMEQQKRDALRKKQEEDAKKKSAMIKVC